jgi:SNF2 family DNA or RNA helicase
VFVARSGQEKKLMLCYNSLTGTPIQNSVEDLFSLFKFLGKSVVQPFHEYTEYVRILRGRGEALTRVEQVQGQDLAATEAEQG